MVGRQYDDPVHTAKAEYMRNYRKTHPEVIQRNQMAYWMRKAEKMKQNNTKEHISEGENERKA